MAKKRKKKARDMTTEEAIRVLFPDDVVDRIKRALADDDDDEKGDDDRKKKRKKKKKDGE